MRYRFRGLKRDTGKAVEGHVEAPTEEMAYQVLGDHAVVTQSLRPDPKPRLPDSRATNQANGPASGAPMQRSAGGDAWDIADAIESAFDTSAQQVAVDRLAERFRGQRVWVIDRDKIRRRVMQVVEQAVAQGQAHKESHEEVRDRIAAAMEEMFKDNRNLTSQVQQSQAQQAPAQQVQQAPAQPAQQSSGELDRQIARLSQVTTSMERAVANMVMVLRSGGGGGGGPARYTHEQRERNEEQNAVLLEIFETNLELRRESEGGDNGSGHGNGDSGEANPQLPAP